MAKPNYQFEKRQRDLAKKKKKEEKRLRKQERTGPEGESAEGTQASEGAGTPATGESSQS